MAPDEGPGYSAIMSDPTTPPESDAPDLEEWAGRYLDLFQRNWTAWLESTPAMIRAALATAEKGGDDHEQP